MAEDNTRRSYRSNDAYRRGASQAEAPEQSFDGSDPLAELARLIGQSDPFTENVRRQPQAAAPGAQHGYDEPHDWRRHVQRPNYDTPEEPAYDADQRYAEDQRYAAADPHAGYADHDPYRMAPTQPEDHHQDHHADLHADHRRAPSYTADYPEEPIYAGAPHHGDRVGAQQQHAVGGGTREDEGYDDPPRRGRGSSLVTAVILIGCAMLGTAGAYGYRTYATAPGTKQAPVIIADSAPSKIVPAEQKSTRSQDRVGGAGNNEQLVSREEQPVTLQTPSTSAVPRVVFPSPVQPGGAPPTTTGTTPPPSASNAPNASTDQPKRIRTLTIRPEGGDSSGQPAAPPPTARTAPPPAQPAPRASRDQPLSLDPNAPTPANEAARPQPQQRPLTPPAPRETAAPAPAARVAAVPPAGGNGGFLVQVSSQKSEADAQSSYRALQAKYSQLKAHQPLIRRADLGNKGVFYRAMVGPFETGDEAVQFCSGLKAAGGQCIIHRN
jgi:hypothetical protein